MRLLLVLALASCGSKDETVVEITGSSSATDVVKGSITVDGKPAVLGACKPGHTVHVFVELLTNVGKLRFEEQQLYWNPVADAPNRGDKLACDKLDRSWGGGVRLPGDGTAYWRGTLAFTCGPITGELTLDCGNITATERAQLDGKRKELQDEQRSPN
jgi:hypothetical protein